MAKKNTLSQESLKEFEGLGLEAGDDPFKDMEKKPAKTISQQSASKPRERKPRPHEKKTPQGSLLDFVHHAENLDKGKFFQGKKLSSIGIPAGIVRYTSDMAKALGISHYHLVTAILHKVVTDHHKEIKELFAANEAKRENLI